MKRMLQLLSLIVPYFHIWFAGVICMLVFTLCNTVSVMGVMPLIDRVLSDKPIELNLSLNVPFKESIEQFVLYLNTFPPLKLLNLICIFLISVTVIKSISQFFQQVLMELVSQKVAKNLREKLFDKFFNLPFNYFSTTKTGELISRITLDVNLVQQIFSGHFTNTILDCLHVFPFFIIVFFIDWKMTLINSIIVPLILLPIIFIGKQIRKFSRRTQQNFADISSNIFEIISAMKIIKVFNQKETEKKKFSAICDKTIKARIKSQKKEAALSPITELIGVSTGVFLLWWFAPNVLSGKMSLGVFMTYLVCVGSMVKPVKTFGKIQITLQNGLAGADRVYQLLDELPSPTETEGKDIDLEFKDRIKFENVSFFYNKEHPVLEKINFEIKKGDVVALVGPSGSGKTTVANMIPRFFDPVEGKIIIDGHDLRDIKAANIRKFFGMVSQEPVLFNASVLENIAYANPSVKMEKIIEAAKLARAHDFITKMDKGYDTLVGERGYRLSGGEKQRIAIARALLKNPQIIIFDEATSALDTENEKYVQEAIDKVMENRTVLVIAHRLSTVVKANKIIVIEKGKIKEQGTHSELMNNKGLYRRLYDMNFSM